MADTPGNMFSRNAPRQLSQGGNCVYEEIRDASFVWYHEKTNIVNYFSHNLTSIMARRLSSSTQVSIRA